MAQVVELSSAKGTYRIVKRVGSADEFTLYLCTNTAGTAHILKIASDPSYNGLLDREAFLFGEMRQYADELEKEFAKVKTDPNTLLNYHFCFPNLVDSFIATNQEGRRVSILSFYGVDDISSLVPLVQITRVDRVRVDPKTSGWILGKLLKILDFAHGQGIAIGRVTGAHICIERDQHFVVVFDWSKASLYQPLPPAIAAAEIAAGAKAVFELLGGDLETGTLPEDEQLVDGRYASHLQMLMSGVQSDAFRAHESFYKLLGVIWPKRGFHPYTTYPIN